MNLNHDQLYLDLKTYLPYRPLLQITPANWRPIVYITLILVVKFIEDKPKSNRHYAERISLFDLKFTNELEHLVLNISDFQINAGSVIVEEYFKWLLLYKQFISNQDSEGENAPVNPNSKMNVEY